MGSNAEKENMKPCQFCRRPFREERIPKHEEACKKKAKAIGEYHAGVVVPDVYRIA